jgi:intracellular sulfur oxidation DsrE/DsrF family protein
MRGRGWLRIVVAAAAAFVLAVPASEASHSKDNPKKHKVVYQLDEPGVDKAKFTLGNIRNHVAGVGGWQHVEAIELVVFGPGLKTFAAKGIDPEVKRLLESLQTQGLQFGVCGNTMKNLSITLEQLPEGSKHLPQGGVVRIMELQEQGYSYIRP